MGIYSAVRQDTAGDYAGRSIAIIGLATPNFWLATLVLTFPAIWWAWAPPLRMVAFVDDPLRNLGHMLIPSLILGTYLSATVMRMTRTMMLEVLRQDFIRTAWAKGLRERVIILRHVIKNALIPVVTLIGLQLPILVGGSVIMENMFALPGLGRLMLEALTARDYPVVSGINLFLRDRGDVDQLVDRHPSTATWTRGCSTGRRLARADRLSPNRGPFCSTCCGGCSGSGRWGQRARWWSWCWR